MMNYSRTSIVAMLVAVEIVLVGLMVFVVRGGFGGGNVFASNGMHQVNFASMPIVPLPAGPAPHVVIDDPDSFVTVEPSTDGLVHATDNTRVLGAIFSNVTLEHLRMARTADGVAIQRPATHGFFSIGYVSQQITVDAPSGARIDVRRASGADVRGFRNDVAVFSQDGHISLGQIDGNVDAHSNDGRIEAADVHGASVKLSSSDGRLIIRNLTATTLDARTNDGRLEVQNLRIEGNTPRVSMHTNDGPVHLTGFFPAQGTYEISTDDGRVELALAAGSDVTVDASTGDGRLSVDGQSFGSDGRSAHTTRVGAGSGNLRVSTGDGSMHITTNGAF